MDQPLWSEILRLIGATVRLALWLQPWQPAVTPPVRDQPPATPGKPSLAVLAFDNLGAHRDVEYFADGLTDDLIADLAKISVEGAMCGWWDR